jgi:hypothetical protein
MNCGDLREYYELYAIGAAQESARAEIAAHLDRRCEACTDGMKRARELVTLVGRRAPRRFGFAPFLAGALALAIFAAVYFGGRERDLAREVERIRAENRERTIELTRVNEAFAILNAADIEVAKFGDDASKARGIVLASASQGVLLVARGLPLATEGKAYQMWIVSKSGTSKPAGIFQSAADGTAMHMQRGALDATAESVAVTLEDRTGASRQMSAPIFTAPLHAQLR